MRRRDFVKAGTFAGLSGALGQGCSSIAINKQHKGPGFDVNPFVKNHPEAVFIQLTDVNEKLNSTAKNSVGKTLAGELIVKTEHGGFPLTTPVNIKPNWTGPSLRNGKPVDEQMGINTDLDFLEGWIQGMKETVDSSYTIRECHNPKHWGLLSV